MNKEIKENIFNTIDDLLKISEWISEWIIRNWEVDDIFSDSIKYTYDILEIDSFEYRKFDNWKTTNCPTIWRMPRHEKEYAKNNNKLIWLIEILKEISIFQNIDEEKHFEIWDDYQIIRFFNKLFNKSKNEIMIIDSYISSNIFDFIDDIDKEISIKIFSSKSKIKSAFKNHYSNYINNNLDVRLHEKEIHDRFVILDKKEIYLVGSSFNWFWKNNFTVKKLNELKKIDEFYSLFEKSSYL